jgi:hypothetical protein
MSIEAHLRDLWVKVAVGVAGSLILGAIYWLHANIVFAGDLTPIAEAVKDLAEQSKEQQDEWRCSELDEELQDYYAQQDELPDGETLPQRDLDRMSRIKERMGDGETGLKCARFED